MNDSAISGDSSSRNQTTPAKKKRNLPGMPDPDAEVITLSPKTLLATNRFVCEICNKGFQRDQNLQLHRRGHNLPWKLRQRSSKDDIRKRVYVCPVSSCVHHAPSRALGDLTGIKKHYCRKHGEKKWKCDKCSKTYAVQSDWKAHSKICGNREYNCDCGNVFTRRDSFITHRAFCNVLAEESVKGQANRDSPPGEDNVLAEESVKGQANRDSPPGEDNNTYVIEALRLSSTSPPPPLPASSVLPCQNIPELSETNSLIQNLSEIPSVTNLTASCSSSSSSSCTNGSLSSNTFASLFASSTSSGTFHSQTTTAPTPTTGFTGMFQPPSSSEATSLCLAMNQGPSIFGSQQYASAPLPAMSATALLQKAAQMGPVTSSESLLMGLGVVSTSSGSSGLEPDGGLCLGLTCDGGSGLKELMRGTTSMFGATRTTLDLLGLGMAATGGSNGGLAALMTSVGAGIDVGSSFGGGREFGGRDNC